MRLAASACLLALALSAAAAAAASQPGACPLDSGLGALSEATVQKFIDSLDGTAIFRGQTQASWAGCGGCAASLAWTHCPGPASGIL